MEIKFILAHPPVEKYAINSLKRLKILDGLKQEAEEHGDMVILDVSSDARKLNSANSANHPRSTTISTLARRSSTSSGLASTMLATDKCAVDPAS